MNKKLKALTLMELLVVLVIIGILVAAALPKFLTYISKAKSTEAQLQLEHLYTLEQTYFYEHSKYSDDLKEVRFEQERLISNGGNANYVIEIVQSSSNNFIARATAVVDFDGDGEFNVWEINNEKNIKELIPD